jgi:hypothetical protein
MTLKSRQKSAYALRSRANLYNRFATEQPATRQRGVTKKQSDFLNNMISKRLQSANSPNKETSQERKKSKP